MCLQAETLRGLCELYPKTGVSLKYRALDGRNFFMKTMQEQELAYGAGRDPKTGLRAEGVRTLADEQIFAETVQDYGRVQLLRAEYGGASPEDSDPRAKRVLQEAKGALTKVKHMQRQLMSLQRDLKDGTLKRVRPSKRPWNQGAIALHHEDAEADDDAVYIELDPEDKPDSSSSSGEEALDKYFEDRDSSDNGRSSGSDDGGHAVRRRKARHTDSHAASRASPALRKKHLLPGQLSAGVSKASAKLLL